MWLLTGHLRERSGQRGRGSGTQEESSYRVPRAAARRRGSTPRGRSVTEKRAPRRIRESARSRAGLPKQRVIGLYAAGSPLRSAPRRATAHGIFARGWLERPTRPPSLPRRDTTRHTRAHSGAEEMRRGACAAWRPLLFSSADSPRNEISALNL